MPKSLKAQLDKSHENKLLELFKTEKQQKQTLLSRQKNNYLNRLKKTPPHYCTSGFKEYS